MAYTVGQVARMARISVRTLHHYEEQGVLTPSGRTEAGYRVYDDEDLDTLQQVLLLKELGFGLEAIGRILSDPEYDRLEALVSQRSLVAEKVERSQALLASIDKAILAEEEGIAMDKEEMFEVFGDFDPAEYEEEVQERWGDTDAYKESARRTKSYRKDDWARLKTETEANGSRMVALFEEGVAAEDERAMDVADEAREIIDRWFYPISKQMHVALAEMYLADPRFKATYEKMSTGLAQWWHDAILANSRRA